MSEKETMNDERESEDKRRVEQGGSGPHLVDHVRVSQHLLKHLPHHRIAHHLSHLQGRREEVTG